MTKVQTRFSLPKPLDEQALTRLEAVHSQYGFFRIQLSPTLDGLSVDYDATRLRPPDVEAALTAAGIPVRAQQ